MKNRLFSLAMCAAVIFAACGEPRQTTTMSSSSDNPAMTPPNNLQTVFVTQYPSASNVVWAQYDATIVPIDWELAGWSALDADDYAVTFVMDNQPYVAWYDSDGTWIGSTYVIDDYTKLPAAVQTTLNTKYSGYAIQKVHQEMWKDKQAFEIKLKKTDDDKVKLLVDKDGNVIKEKLKD
jgi:hypothetical protein